MKAQTPRLLLRPFEPSDAAGFLALNADPEVLKHTGDQPFRDLAHARAFILAYDHYKRHGFGRWSVLAKDDDRYMGFCGLRRSESSGDVDLGFRLMRAFWGRGYATEAANKALELGFEAFGLKRIIARAVPDNKASLRVLQKLHMSPCGMQLEGTQRWLVHELTLDAWKTLSSHGK